MKQIKKHFKKYFTTEIGIEFKACLYFFAILLYYSTYRIIGGSLDANIIVMAEIIASTYIMGYIQVYLLRNFDEAESFGPFELVAVTGCSLVYGAESYFLNWFDKDLVVSIIFVGYMLFCYLCVIAIYYFKRLIDTELLNEELEEFKKKGDNEDESDRD